MDAFGEMIAAGTANLLELAGDAITYTRYTKDGVSVFARSITAEFCPIEQTQSRQRDGRGKKAEARVTLKSDDVNGVSAPLVNRDIVTTADGAKWVVDEIMQSGNGVTVVRVCKYEQTGVGNPSTLWSR